jgi:hypothetical protein
MFGMWNVGHVHKDTTTVQGNFLGSLSIPRLNSQDCYKIPAQDSQNLFIFIWTPPEPDTRCLLSLDALGTVAASIEDSRTKDLRLKDRKPRCVGCSDRRGICRSEGLRTRERSRR